jgi:hypothetical protein
LKYHGHVYSKEIVLRWRSFENLINKKPFNIALADKYMTRRGTSIKFSLLI